MNTKPVTTQLNTNQFKFDYVDREPAQKKNLPTGPLDKRCDEHQYSLLIFVPRNAIGALTNEMTGVYGYSHLAIDCGEFDIPSGKRIMVEATFGLGVNNSFQDEYGERKFVRIPLEKVGINISEFCNCVRSKLGEKFDEEEVLTIGIIHDPAKQICSHLATGCLPEKTRKELARYQQSSFLYYLSNIWPSGGSNKIFRLFVTPNGFAEYFGAPKGEQLDRPDQLSEPIFSTRRKSSKKMR